MFTPGGAVRSGHLHRSARLEPHPSWREGEGNHFDDDALAAGWLAGRTHPRTGEPLRIARLSAPPDTMVSVHTHIPHGVAPRAHGRGTRWCVTFNFASADPDRSIPRSPERLAYGLPAEWHDAAMEGRIPGVDPNDNIFSLW